MKLHLGCGQIYLPGYCNIDFPPEHHSVQTNVQVDRYADLTTLQFESGSVEEIRLHHVFEHFSRPLACAFLVGWHNWLMPDGVLRIEVPDFGRSGKQIFWPWSSDRARCVAQRHIFGSHEAAWAVHYAGYTRAELKRMLTEFGFRVEKIERLAWRKTFNVDVWARREHREWNPEEMRERARAYLARFLVDEGESETRLLQVWMQIFDAQCRKNLAPPVSP